MTQKTVNVTLSQPFEKAGAMIDAIELRKPCAGDLRGLTLVDVVQMDFAACGTLLTRISCLNERDLLNIDVENLTPLLLQIAGFFVNTNK